MYDESYIAGRITARRKELKISKNALAKKLAATNYKSENSTRVLISSWENETGKGKKVIPGIASLCDLCDALDCDIEYLLGAIDAPHRETHDVIKETGLSISAVERLKAVSSSESFQQKVINTLLTAPAFWDGRDSVINRLRAASEILSYQQDNTDGATKMGVHRIETNSGAPARFAVDPQTAAEVQIQFAADSIKELFRVLLSQT